MNFLKLLLIPIFAFSYELEFDKKFSYELPHDTLSTFITITITDDSEIIVGDRLEIFNKKIKSFDKVERKLGNYNIRPKYRHSANTPKVIGYTGELSYKINSRKARFLDEFIGEITKLKRNRDTTVSVTDLAWSVKEETYNVTLDLLRLEAINWINVYVINLSKNLNRDCSIKKIEINKTEQMMIRLDESYYSNAAISNKSVPIPDFEQKRIKINPKYIVECK